MAPRPNWKGHLKLSLVSCAIALYPATSASERISFNQLNKKTGIREAMKGKGMVGLGRVVISKRERPIILAKACAA